MLMMRPARAFIMVLRTARDSRNTAVRLVSSTAAQSSSFMRMARVSRVMPALLTRICGPPSAASSATSASHAGASLTSSTTPRPPDAANISEMDSAPACEVAVPTTCAPRPASSRAMALPMPRVAPVTNAVLPLSSCCTCLPLQSFQSCTQRLRVADRKPDQITINAFDQSGQHLSRSTLDHMGDPLGLHELYGFHPSHRMPGLAHQRILDGRRVVCTDNIHVID